MRYSFTQKELWTSHIEMLEKCPGTQSIEELHSWQGLGNTIRILSLCLPGSLQVLSQSLPRLIVYLKWLWMVVCLHTWDRLQQDSPEIECVWAGQSARRRGWSTSAAGSWACSLGILQASESHWSTSSLWRCWPPESDRCWIVLVQVTPAVEKDIKNKTIKQPGL